MKLLVIDKDYPSSQNLYGDVFAHVRVKEYLRNDYEVIVIAHYDNREIQDYVYEGVNVVCPNNFFELNRAISEYGPDKILIHFATFDIIKNVVLKNNGYRYLIWVHGYEALSFIRRRFNYNLRNLKSLYHFYSYGKNNIRQLLIFRKLIRSSNKRIVDIDFIFVSNWMRKTTSRDCLVRVKNYSIIPNPIDNRFFEYREKEDLEFYNILMIRPFTSKKYGTDIATDLITILSEKSYFKDFRFTICGGGLQNSNLYHRFKEYSNFTFIDGFINHDQVKALHRKNGLFFCFTRQDAQGVSMCEAMSSGMVVFTSNNTAIPEFVNKGSGILTENKPEDIAEYFANFSSKISELKNMSREASASISVKAGIKAVITKELELINR